MNPLGVQTKNIVKDHDPAAGFQTIKAAGFSCADFSLNTYLKKSELYTMPVNHLFDRSLTQLEAFFTSMNV